MKFCIKCKLDKDESRFSKCAKYKDGLQHWCKDCRKEYDKILYQKKKPLRILQSNSLVRKISKKVFEYKIGKVCKNCPENHPACLVFHHRDKSTKIIEISNAARKGWSFKRILTEIEKCDILCANCHHKLHYEERIRVVV